MCARYAIHASRPMENKEREETRLWPIFLCGDAAEKSTSDEVEESRAMGRSNESFCSPLGWQPRARRRARDDWGQESTGRWTAYRAKFWDRGPRERRTRAARVRVCEMSSLRVTEVISSRNTATLFLHRANALPHIHILIIGRHRQHSTLTNFTKKEREKN